LNPRSHELGAVKPWVDERGVPESDVTIETGQVKLDEPLELTRSEVRAVVRVVLDKLDAAELGARKPGGLTELGALERRATFELGPIDVGRSLEADAIKLGVPPKASTVEPRFSDKLYAVELGAPTELRLSEDSHRVEGATEDGVPPELSTVEGGGTVKVRMDPDVPVETSSVKPDITERATLTAGIEGSKEAIQQVLRERCATGIDVRLRAEPGEHTVQIAGIQMCQATVVAPDAFADAAVGDTRWPVHI